MGLRPNMLALAVTAGLIFGAHPAWAMSTDTEAADGAGSPVSTSTDPSASVAAGAGRPATSTTPAPATSADSTAATGGTTGAARSASTPTASPSAPSSSPPTSSIPSAAPSGAATSAASAPATGSSRTAAPGTTAGPGSQAAPADATDAAPVSGPTAGIEATAGTDPAAEADASGIVWPTVTFQSACQLADVVVDAYIDNDTDVSFTAVLDLAGLGRDSGPVGRGRSVLSVMPRLRTLEAGTARVVLSTGVEGVTVRRTVTGPFEAQDCRVVTPPIPQAWPDPVTCDEEVQVDIPSTVDNPGVAAYRLADSGREVTGRTVSLAPGEVLVLDVDLLPGFSLADPAAWPWRVFGAPLCPTPSAPPDPTATAALPATAAPEELAATGSDSAPWAGLVLPLLAAGTLLVRLRSARTRAR